MYWRCIGSPRHTIQGRLQGGESGDRGAARPPVRRLLISPLYCLQPKRIFYFASKYCNDYVCLFVCLLVCLSVRSHNSKPHGQLHQIFMHVACGRGSILLRRRRNMLVLPVLGMTSCFHTMEPMSKVKHDVIIRRVHQVGV